MCFKNQLYLPDKLVIYHSLRSRNCRDSLSAHPPCSQASRWLPAISACRPTLVHTTPSLHGRTSQPAAPTINQPQHQKGDAFSASPLSFNYSFLEFLDLSAKSVTPISYSGNAIPSGQDIVLRPTADCNASNASNVSTDQS